MCGPWPRKILSPKPSGRKAQFLLRHRALDCECSRLVAAIELPHPYNASMGISFLRVGVVLVLATLGGMFAAPHALVAQGGTGDQETNGHVVLGELFPPIYPPLAQQALVSGDVHLRISVHADGEIETIAVIDGPPLLVPSALASAKRSNFDCKYCGQANLVEGTFTYSFQLSEQKPTDSNCCLGEQSPSDKATHAQVSQSAELITVTAPARCICSDEYLGTLMDRRMRLIAGNSALDCGRVKVNGDPRQSLRCARRAISQRQAFVVRFDSAGMDSSLSDGFAGDGSGKVYGVSFDSLGIGPSVGLEVLDNGHDAVEICPRPVHIKARSAPNGAFWGYRCTRKQQ